MKKTIILSAALFSVFAFSQIGINTSNPQGVFSIDAAKDNPETGTPSAAQQANDVTVTPTGNVGIGTVTPTTKLDIASSTAGALKISDGSQADGRVLTSDANGVATWKPMAFSTNIEGTWLINNFQAATNNSIPVRRYTSIARLILPSAGTYLVFLNADFGFINTTSTSGYVEYLVTEAPVTNAADLAGAIGAIPGTWNTMYNSIKVTMGSFTINNTFFITTTQAKNLYLTVRSDVYNNTGTGTALQRWGNIQESPAYGPLPGGLAIDRFVAYKF